MTKLGDVCTVVSGSTPKTNNPAFWDGDINWITPAELDDSTVVINESQRKITQEGVRSCGLTEMPVGTVILSSRAPIGKTAIAGVPMYCNQGFKNLICSERIFNKYLFWFLRENTEFLQSLGRGATFKEISKKIVEEIEIPLPPLNRQKEIANSLDRINELIVLHSRQRTKLDELVKARFVEMFGDPMVNPKRYETKPYGKLFELNAGGTPSKTKAEYWEGGTISWIGSNLCQDVILYENDGKYISQEGYDHSSARMFPIDTVLIALVGATIGKTALLKFETSTNQNVLGIRHIKESGYNPLFVYYYTQFLYQKFLNIGDGGFNMASKGFVSELPMYDITLPAQNEFATFAEQVDKSKEAVQRGLEKLETLKKALMQEYFV